MLQTNEIEIMKIKISELLSNYIYCLAYHSADSRGTNKGHKSFSLDGLAHDEVCVACNNVIMAW